MPCIRNVFDLGQPSRKLSLHALILMAILGFGALPAQSQSGAAPSQTPEQASGDSSKSQNRISEDQLVGLPMNGRSYSQLATLEAGISNTSSESSSRGVGGGSINVSGARGTANVFLLDGTNVMGTENQSPRSAAGVQLGSDSVLQVHVFGTNYSAEYGRGSGGVLNSITRSGSSEFHGSLFEYFRNSKLDARNFFDTGSNPPPFKRNQFGFTLSGPIKRDKTFFMFSFEALRDRLTETDNSSFPDLNARVGVITSIRDGKVVVDNPCVSPNTDQAGKSYCVHPNVRPYVDLFPVPNGEPLGGGVSEHRFPRFEPSDDEFAVLRIDHQFSLRDSLFARYAFDDARTTGSGSTYLFQQRQNSRNQYLTVNETHFFSAGTINSFRFGYTRPSEDNYNVSHISIPRSLFFISDAPDFGQLSIPRVSGFGPGSGGPSATIFDTLQFSDDVVLQRGLHTLKFGGQVHRYYADTFTNSNRAGNWSFNSLDSFLQSGPEGTNLVGVLPGSSNRQFWRQTLFGFYGNDSFALRPNLRIDLGLRYEFSTLIHDKDGKSVFIVDPWTAKEASIGPYLDHNPSIKNLSPRLGLSWSLGGSRNTVVRAGFGIYYDQILPYVVSQQKASAPYYKKTVRTNFNASGKDASGNPLPYAFPNADAVLQGLALQSQVMDYQNFRSTMVHRYDMEIQTELSGGWNTRFSYVGARANHLYRRYEINLYPAPVIRADGTVFLPPQCNQLQRVDSSGRVDANYAADLAVCRPYAGPMNPNFTGGLSYQSSDAQSFYNSLRIAANKRLTSGASLSASYTFSKSVDDITSSGGSDVGSGGQYPLMRTIERGLSDFDSRHNLSFNYFYPLPFGRGQSWLASGPAAAIIGGWRLGGIVRYRTGTPLSPGLSVRKPGYLFEATRPNLAPGQSNDPATEGLSAGCGANNATFAGDELGTPRRYFDPCNYVFPGFGNIGNAGRNTITGPNLFATDVSLQRDFSVGGDRRLQFRMEMFNFINHTNFSGPRGSALSVFTGITAGVPRINSSAGRISGTSTTARQVQFALRLSF